MDDVCRPVRLAALLAHAGAEFVVVGGATRWLSGDVRRPLDLDVVVPPDAVPRLVAALSALGVATSTASLLRQQVVRVGTSWGPMDVFVGTPDAPPTPVVAHGVAWSVSYAAASFAT